MEFWDPRCAMEQLGGKVLRELGYGDQKHLASGAYGSVFALKTKDGLSSFAAKMTFPQKDTGELELWPNLKHTNLLPLLDIITRPDMTIFLMPLHILTLEQVIEEEDFISKSESYNFVRQWLRQVLNGLEYLHGLKLCHLDLKKNNVLITSHLTAVICDFGHLNIATKKTTFVGLPMQCRPPEAFFTDLSLRPEVNGIPFDIWSFGMLSLHILMKPRINVYYIQGTTWLTAVYPKLYDVLQTPAFHDLMTASYPSTEIQCEELMQAKNLICGTLRHIPEDRPLTSSILVHPFFTNSRNEELLTEDSFWQVKENNCEKQIPARKGLLHWFLKTMPKYCCCIM